MAELLSNDQVDIFISNNPEWEHDGKAITRQFEFEDFNEAYGFLTRVALQAERMFHHPDIEISWNKVKVTLSTHSEGGITDADTKLAEFCNGAA